MLSPQVTVGQAVDLVAHSWQQSAQAGAISEQSAEKFTGLLIRFSRFADAYSFGELEAVDTHLVTAFIRARGHSRRGDVSVAAVATIRLRRSVLRCFFRTARHLMLTDTDPTLDVELPGRPGRRVRPLETEEADLVRHFAQLTENATRHAATTALALSGLGSGEISTVTPADLDLEDGWVRACGAARTRPRSCPLDAWAVQALTRRVNRLPQPGLPVVGTEGGTPAQRQARVCTTLREVLVQAGLGDDPSLRPASLTAHPGLMAFRNSGRIEDAARLLGMASLDKAAELVGYHWPEGNSRPADAA